MGGQVAKIKIFCPFCANFSYNFGHNLMYTPNSSCSLLFENSKQFLVYLLINFFNIRRVLQQTVYGKLQTFPIIHCQDSAAPYIGSGPKEIDIKEGCTFFNL